MHYYREFLVFCKPLQEAHHITDEERNSMFWYGFHPRDQEKMLPRLLGKYPDRSAKQPYDFEEVFKITQAVFTTFTASPFFPIQLQERWEQSTPHYARSERPAKRWFGQSELDPQLPDHEGCRRERDHFLDYNPRDAFARPDWDIPCHTNPPPRAPSPPRNTIPSEPKTVRFTEPTREEEDHELYELMDKMHGLSVRERTYAVLYARCAHCYPDVTSTLPRPEIVQTFSYQPPATPSTSHHQP
ncbi:hypothetical protein EDB92DRAFT_1942973 [Lactarius akahatsu]|uniref:Uncharacterized protein n=1 Tax=Lactarius akahatsu TaxID=416441 RepID=A0AAD4LR38_9AGAM|nr:hypothetical protein EDB92DRAFT_1942973 [Lactarius akahatsu]